MGRTSVALTAAGGDGSMLVRRLDAGSGQAERLVPLIGNLMAEADIPYLSLDRIAVCTGPGGFSGIRSGVAAARGIGLAAGVPVVGATSFRIMAAAFEDAGDCPDSYGIVASAGLNAYYCQIVGRGGVEHSPIKVMPASELGAFFIGKTEILTGPAAQAVACCAAAPLPVRSPELAPDAAALAAIAPNLCPNVDQPSPHYVRLPDARPQTAHLIARADR